MDIVKVVIPVAGLGTRLLPATKSQPKEMLPVGRKPVVQYVVEEVVEQGLKKILFITGRDKRTIEDHFDRDPELQNYLSERDRENLLDELDYEQEGVRFFYTRQIIPSGRTTPAGIGDAISRAEDFVAGEPFVVAFGDTIIKSGNHAGLVRRMIKSHQANEASCTIAVTEVPDGEESQYGIVKPKAGEAEDDFEIEHIVEKPTPDNAPSNLGVAARYIFNPEIFTALSRTTPGYRGELELTDAIATLLKMGHSVRCVKLHPEELRYDIGDLESYFKSFIDFTLFDQRYGYLIRQYLQKRLRDF
jgi:UTP--glucose-1-phosphate uridylyltransferase